MRNHNANNSYWQKNIITLQPRIVDGKLFKPKLLQGYICSNCGKREVSPKERCSGCGADMCKRTIDVR